MPDKPRAGETRKAFIARAIKYLIKEGKTREQAAGQAYGMWNEHIAKKKGGK